MEPMNGVSTETEVKVEESVKLEDKIKDCDKIIDNDEEHAVEDEVMYDEDDDADAAFVNTEADNPDEEISA